VGSGGPGRFDRVWVVCAGFCARFVTAIGPTVFDHLDVPLAYEPRGLRHLEHHAGEHIPAGAEAEAADDSYAHHGYAAFAPEPLTNASGRSVTLSPMEKLLIFTWA
jgi:hypothetical protein